jgi:hypothetical protein
VSEDSDPAREGVVRSIDAAPRLRSVLRQTHDAMAVALESLERTNSMIEQMWPAISANGHVGAPVGDQDSVQYAQALAYGLPASELRRLLHEFGDEADRQA